MLRRQRIKGISDNLIDLDTHNDITLESLESLDFSKVECGYKTVTGYVSAICDLFTFQKQYQNNSYDHPRTKEMKKLIEAVKKIVLKEKDEGFHDRLKDTALDTVTFTQYMENASFLGLNDKNEAVCIGYRLDALLMYSTMGRSQITRNLRLSEIGVEYVSTNEQENKTQAIRLTLNKGKTNQYERVLSVGILR